MSDAARPWTVTQLTRRVGELLGGLGRVSVEGEVSRIVRATSGHVYFDLKDLDSKLACKVWRSQVDAALRFELAEGMQVVAHGKLDVYGPQGSYSLIVQRVEHAGVGAMLAQLEKLKAELKARGWFDRKRVPPVFPRVIGVATSRDGAAFQDFLRTRSLRWPLYPVRLCHTPVQGAGAAPAIAQAIRALDASGVDVIVVCRGGGSLEDLWAFNELPVAEAIWNTSVPVVTGVGHEVDVTLADFVADVRAHTPTDAAQRVIPDRAAWVDALERQRDHMEQAVDEALSRRGDALERCGRSRVLRDASWILDERFERLARGARDLARSASGVADAAQARLAVAARALDRASPANQLARRQTRFEVAASRLAPGLERVVRRRLERMASLERELGALSPLRVLERGYSITARGGSTEPLTSGDALRAGDELETTFHRGRARSRVVALDTGGSSSPAARVD